MRVLEKDRNRLRGVFIGTGSIDDVGGRKILTLYFAVGILSPLKYII